MGDCHSPRVLTLFFILHHRLPLLRSWLWRVAWCLFVFSCILLIVRLSLTDDVCTSVCLMFWVGLFLWPPTIAAQYGEGRAGRFGFLQ